MEKITVCEPPPVLDLARVFAWARTDSPVVYTGNMLMFDGNDRLDQVPNLAICQYFDDLEMVLLHCDEFWNVIGSSGKGTLADIKAQAEVIYQNITGLWQEMTVGEEEAKSFLKTTYKEEVCLFCSRRMDQVELMFSSGNGVICGDCVSEFYRQKSDDPWGNMIDK